MSAVLHFHRDVYLGTAVDEAIHVFAKFGTFARSEDASHWVVEVTAKKAERERALAGEFGNYALGLTIKAQHAP